MTGTKIAKFEAILDAEFDANGAKVSVDFAPGNLPERLKVARHKNWKTAQKKLSDMIDALSLDEMKAYGEYRKNARR